MAKAIFIQNPNSNYKDIPGVAYHFPKSYLSRVQQTLGDWVILYEASKSGGRGVYFAVQRVERIEQDPTDADHYFAYYNCEESRMLDFVATVPIKDNSGQYYETNLNWQSAVRIIDDAVFDRIVQAGMTSIHDGFHLHSQAEMDVTTAMGFAENAETFINPEVERTKILTSRSVRDAKFREAVVRAYDGRCAVSGLRLRNGGGRPEVQAAHIRSVEKGGPDIVQNGLALSSTVHWMFDRALISVDDDFKLLVAKDSLADEVAGRLIHEGTKISIPPAAQLQPHKQFLEWHRENIFKG